MAILSAILYFFNHHFILAMPVLWISGALLAMVMVRWRGNMAWSAVAVAGMLVGMLNPFFGSMVNGSFLDAFGVHGSGVITSVEQTSSQLNDQYIDAYEAVVRTADGRDVGVEFDTMSATLFPWRNRIDIPPRGERFVVKYIPGFERNFAIMRDESPFGRRILLSEARRPVERAEARLAASPENEEFRQKYREEARRFLDAHGEDADPELVRKLRSDMHMPLNVVARQLARGGGDDMEAAARTFLEKHGADISPDLVEPLRNRARVALSREVMELGTRPVDDAYYENVMRLLGTHGKDMQPGLAGYLAVHAREPVSAAADRLAERPDDAQLKQQYHDAIRLFLDRYGEMDPGYARYLQLELEE